MAGIINMLNWDNYIISRKRKSMKKQMLFGTAIVIPIARNIMLKKRQNSMIVPELESDVFARH